MATYDDHDFEASEFRSDRRHSYGVRRAKPTRRRVNKPKKNTSYSPGGIRQRRNKHWNW